MRYWNVQRIVREYVCPVRMVTQILGEMSAPDIFKARNTDIRELKEVCEIIAEICAAREKVPQGKNRTICFLKGRRHAKVRKYPFSHFRRGQTKVWSLTRSNEYGYV